MAPFASTSASKKGKGKKPTDPNEASKLIAAKISQLELDAAGEKDQEAEIGACTLWSLEYKFWCRSFYVYIET
jgi:hypothetical protein